MAGRSEFNEKEWETLHRGVTGAAMLVSVSDLSLFDSFKEAGALSRQMTEARSAGSSDLVRELARERGTGFSFRTQPDELERETFELLHEAISLLEAKAPDEKDAYRDFVVEVAQSVAEGAGGGERAEAETLEKIRSALGGGDGSPAAP
jgi:hypothetical protein